MEELTDVQLATENGATDMRESAGTEHPGCRNLQSCLFFLPKYTNLSSNLADLGVALPYSILP